MTCIVGVRTKGGVLLGGDSLGSNGWTGTSYRAPKVFRLTPEVAAGYTTSFRLGQLLEHHLSVPAITIDERTWAITELIPSLRETLKGHGYAHVQNNEESGGNFLLAVRGRLFEVQGDYSVVEPRFPFAAVGSGEQLAMGAMHALHKPALKNHRAFLKAALDAASAFAVGVAPPYHFTSTC